MGRQRDAEDGIIGEGHYPRPGDDDYRPRKRRSIPAPVYITEQVAPLGPECAEMLRRNCTHQFGGVGVCVLCGTNAYRSPSPRPVVAALLRDVAAGIRVLNTMNGYRIPEELIQERAANIVTGLIGNYDITNGE